MKTRTVALILALLAIAAATNSVIMARTQTSSMAAATGHARIVLSQTFPKLDGSHLKVSIVEVNYGPGASSPAHTHPCPVVGYIVQGTIRIQVKGEPASIYKAGESFYETPNGVHLISENVSDKEPAKLIAYFTCDHETPLTIPVPERQPGGSN